MRQQKHKCRLRQRRCALLQREERMGDGHVTGLRLGVKLLIRSLGVVALWAMGW
jgi:hypothetical protein